jgi:hypothetical protein
VGHRSSKAKNKEVVDSNISWINVQSPLLVQLIVFGVWNSKVIILVPLVITRTILIMNLIVIPISHHEGVVTIVLVLFIICLICDHCSKLIPPMTGILIITINIDFITLTIIVHVVNALQSELNDRTVSIVRIKVRRHWVLCGPEIISVHFNPKDWVVAVVSFNSGDMFVSADNELDVVGLKFRCSTLCDVLNFEIEWDPRNSVVLHVESIKVHSTIRVIPHSVLIFVPLVHVKLVEQSFSFDNL